MAAALRHDPAEGAPWLEPGSDPGTAYRALRAVDGIGDRLATAIVGHALHWPDAFTAADLRLRRAVGASSPRDLLAQAESWRPWRAYAALHLLLDAELGPLDVRCGEAGASSG